MANRSEIKKGKRKKKTLKILGSIIGILLLAGAGYAYYVYSSVKDTVGKMHDDSEWSGSDKRDDELNLSNQDPISILILGVDERKGDRGRSDTTIVVTVNPKTNSMYMTSIPRDTRTEIIGKGTQDKINHAYAFGGTKMAIETVENFLDIPIDYFMKVNMESFKGIVNALGGVTVNNEKFGFSYEGHNFPKGSLNLSGEEALAYSRMRKQDPRGDFGRNERQRQVINSIIDEGAQLSSITKLGEILGVMGDNITTNMSFDEMKEIQSNYKGARKNVQSLEIKGRGGKINGIYYFNVSDEEKKRISSLLKEQLEL
ncbi:LCP family protein required for cell wall assembly [Fictibacillus barbaricus]|uniref:Polyisoprenyl-teichoic acid--peptidoglycan teichoic acid transferase TagU n=1 Tax=Fictibacillus barbaricus TaxID=182136 RepID=A0ABU1U156_9BACL|nr:LytR family transcriptional regulator [Fictibacillus barbaricus]MDR7073188.1 LCP family protein required for cell wall assembly [Fictibacillus barbaricus]